MRCLECKTFFLPIRKSHRCCSEECSGIRWRRKHRKELVAYNKKWIAKNPGAIAQYNERKRKAPRHIICAFCKVSFLSKYGQRKYCSPRCRSKARMLRPGEKEKAKIRSKANAKNNKPRLRAWYRDYYPGYAQRKMIAQPWSTLLTGAKRRAKIKKITFDLTPEWAIKRWTGACELTGLPFSEPVKRVGYKNRNMSPSIDRIHPTGGYTQDNCRIILWAVNGFKRDSSDSDMYKIARALIARADRKD